MDRETFCNTVLSRVRYATDRERTAIRRELEGHLEDHAADLVRLGWPESEAEERALAAMGDPAEIGRALNREYPLGWLVLSRAVLPVIAVLGLLTFAAWCVMPFQIFRNVQARTDPAAYLSLYNEEYGLEAVTEPEVRVDLGDQVLWVYQTGLDAETGKADLLACLYHKDPLKKTQRDLLARAGEELTAAGGEAWVKSTNGGARYLEATGIPAERGADLTLTCGAYGNRRTVAVPLPWEELP